MLDQEDEQTLLEKVEKLQASLIGYATQDGGGLEIADFMRLREEIINDGRVKGKIPDIIRRYRDRGQFWQFIKHKFHTYHERREYIWQEIRPLIVYLEAQDRSPGVQPITEALVNFDSQHVESISNRGLCGLLLNFQLLFVLHSRIPANEGLPELVIEHLRSDLQ
jgi:hypothetical protein